MQATKTTFLLVLLLITTAQYTHGLKHKFAQRTWKAAQRKLRIASNSRTFLYTQRTWKVGQRKFCTAIKNRNLLYVCVSSEALCRLGQVGIASRPNNDYHTRHFSQRGTNNLSAVGKRTTEVIFGANAVVLAAWWIAIASQKLNGRKDVLKWMEDHFLEMSNRSIGHTALTAAFSHRDWKHFASNMSALRFFAPDALMALGPRRFSYFYVTAAYAATWFDRCMFSRLPPLATLLPRDLYVELRSKIDHFLSDESEVLPKEVPEFELSPRQGKPTASLGASGILSAVVTYTCLANPQMIVSFGRWADTDGIPAPVAALIWAAADILYLHSGDNIGHGDHLGGALFGALVWAAERFKNGGHRQIIHALKMLGAFIASEVA